MGPSHQHFKQTSQVFVKHWTVVTFVSTFYFCFHKIPTNPALVNAALLSTRLHLRRLQESLPA